MSWLHSDVELRECSAQERRLLLVVERAQRLPNRVGVALVAVLGEGAQQFARCVLKNQLAFGRFIADAIRARVVMSPGRAGPSARASWLVGVSKMGG